MFGRIILSIAVGVSALSAQGIPDRPEKITFPQLSFQVPKAKDYKASLKNKIPVFISAYSGGEAGTWSR